MIEHKIFDLFEKFIFESRNSAWLEADGIKMYVRKGRQFSFTIANIQIDLKGKGTFTKLIRLFDISYPNKTLMVENVLEERFQKYFERNHWQKLKYSDPPCYAKVLG